MPNCECKQMRRIVLQVKKISGKDCVAVRKKLQASVTTYKVEVCD